MNETILSSNAPAFSTYDYSDLDPAIATHVQELVRGVKAGITRQVDTIIDIGRDLTAAKEHLGHGRFGKWLAAEEFGFSERTAENYMAAFAGFGSKSAIVANLKQPTTIYALARAPLSAREHIVHRIEAGERMTDTDIREAVAEAKHIERQELQQAKLSPEAKQRIKAKAARRARDREKDMAENEAIRARQADYLQQAYAIIVDRLGDELPTILALLDETWQTELARGLAAARDRASQPMM